MYIIFTIGLKIALDVNARNHHVTIHRANARGWEQQMDTLI